MNNAIAQLEPRLQAVFCEILGLDDIAPGASFIDLGGVSIEAEEIAARLSEELNVKISMVDILECATLAQVTAIIRLRLDGDISARKRLREQTSP